jgi:hypothetical protein
MTLEIIFVLAAVVVLMLADLVVAWARLRRKVKRGRTHA